VNVHQKKESNMLEHYVQKIEKLARQSRTETKLQIGLEHVLLELLAHFQISYEPSVNEILQSQG